MHLAKKKLLYIFFDFIIKIKNDICAYFLVLLWSGVEKRLEWTQTAVGRILVRMPEA